MKKILILLFTLMLTACSVAPSSPESSDALKFKQEYESLNETVREKDGKTIRSVSIPKDNQIIYSNYNEIAKKMKNKDDFIVYFGFSDCPWCRATIETALKIATKKNIEEIYYVDVKDSRNIWNLNENGEAYIEKEGGNGYFEVVNLLGNVLDDYNLTDDEGNIVPTHTKRIYAPNYVIVVDGKAEAKFTGISEKMTDGYMDITEEIQEDMDEEFEKYFEMYKDLTSNSIGCTVQGC